MQRKTMPIQESIPVGIYDQLLDFGNVELMEGIQNAVYLAYTMEVTQESQTDEEMKIWRRLLSQIDG